MMVARLLGGHSHRTDTSEPKKTKISTRESLDAKLGDIKQTDLTACCTRDPVQRLDTFQQMASVLQHEQEHDVSNAATDKGGVTISGESVVGGGADEEINHDEDGNYPPNSVCASHEGTDNAGKKMNEDETDEEHENKKLQKMGLNTALAIGLHNFPEGTFLFVKS
jgi:zinc transporter ZupT